MKTTKWKVAFSPLKFVTLVKMKADLVLILPLSVAAVLVVSLSFQKETFPSHLHLDVSLEEMVKDYITVSMSKPVALMKLLQS